MIEVIIFTILVPMVFAYNFNLKGIIIDNLDKIERYENIFSRLEVHKRQWESGEYYNYILVKDGTQISTYPNGVPK